VGQPVVPLDRAELEAIRYADVEALLIGWLTAAFGVIGGKFVSEEPDPGELPGLLVEHGTLTVVSAFGGVDRNPAQDVANVDVDTYVPGDANGNPDPGAAQDYAELLRSAFLFRLPGYYTTSATVSGVATMSRPCARPYDDDASTVRRVGATYQVTVKSH
jgi:hypothetical protein